MFTFRSVPNATELVFHGEQNQKSMRVTALALGRNYRYKREVRALEEKAGYNSVKVDLRCLLIFKSMGNRRK